VNCSNLGAILLAAGASSRLGYPKQLVKLDGDALVVRQARLLIALQPACVVVVTGAAREGVEQALAGLPVGLVHNANWEQGMGSSLACGVRAMPERVRGALLLLVDQWRICDADLDSLVSAWQAAPLRAATAAWDGKTGPPVIFPRALFQRLAKLGGEQGARNLLRGFAGGVVEVALPNAAWDLDVSSDFRSSTGIQENWSGEGR